MKEAELAAEELQHAGTLPRFFARIPELFAYLSRYWLGLVETTRDTERSTHIGHDCPWIPPGWCCASSFPSW
jgi:hypothetical protein